MNKRKTKSPKEIDALLEKISRLENQVRDLHNHFHLVKVEKEKHDLEARQAQAEKMEAIGRLAGGLAHDMNNVLSAIVSYPDLLLLKLPQDSPMRKPILTIQKAGQKAAAIIEDLLTLTRRGIPSTEVLNLNEIIEKYLSTLEYETLKRFKPQITIQVSLEPELLNIKGSSKHLTQTVMDLVSNIVENTQGQGTIHISTINRNLDIPDIGYDSPIPPGDYVLLSVTETDAGVYYNDIKRIFEPFYTKNVMGRSSPGLGMAVVWGTVKLHNGYIKVTADHEKGYSFELFFPVSREKIKNESNTQQLNKYAGHKEHILLVDDIKDQREISSALLTSLNYSVHAVESGEKAVEYLKTHSADLVILDMIMDPGMDGLDTYKHILNIHPGQKTIITSGYAETQRVHEAQKLGAGQYIKKPYTLDKIGQAVRTELDK